MRLQGLRGLFFGVFLPIARILFNSGVEEKLSHFLQYGDAACPLGGVGIHVTEMRYHHIVTRDPGKFLFCSRFKSDQLIGMIETEYLSYRVRDPGANNKNTVFIKLCIFTNKEIRQHVYSAVSQQGRVSLVILTQDVL